MRAVLAALAFVLASTFAAGAQTSPDAVLKANKAAMGGDAWSSKIVVRIDGALTGLGLSGTMSSLTDLRDGRSVDSYDYGPAQGGGGFDGKTPWQRDTSGAVSIQKGGDALVLAINDAYRNANTWWAADFGGAKIASKGEISDANRRYDVLSITPKGGKEFEAWFDAESHLLAKTIEQQGADTVTTTISDYRPEDGVMMPHSFVIDGGLGEKYVQRIRVTKITFETARPDITFAPQTQTLTDFTLAGDETTIPIEILNNHVYGQVRINGAGPFNFIFDTGAHNIIAPPIATLLGVSMQGRVPGTGAGEGVVDGGFVNGLSLSIGTAALQNQTFFVFPIDDLSEIEGQPLPGVVGYETFRRFVTRIDYGAGTLTLIDPAKFDPKDAGTPIPFEFNDHLPEVKGTFEGLPATFDIDTGSRAELTLTKPYAEQYHLRDSHPKGVEAMEGWGVGGPLTGYVTRGHAMTLGPVAIGPVVASLNNQDKGAFAGASYSGNVGGGILKRFIVTFDYGKQILYLKPRPGPVEDAGSYDRAGLWLNLGGGGFRVIAVTKTAPAEEAGLQLGDIIVAVDAKPTSDIKLADLRARLRNDPPGTVIRFTVSRSGKLSDINVILRDLI